MRQHAEYRLILGILIWIGIVTGLFIFLQNSFRSSATSPQMLFRYVTQEPQIVRLQLKPAQWIRIGDPIFVETDDGPRVIGRIKRVEAVDSIEKRICWTDTAFAEMYTNAPKLVARDSFTHYETPESFAWVAATMLSDETRREISDLILRAYHDHRAEIVSVLRPIVEGSIRDASSVIREDLEAAFRARDSEIARLGEKFQTELVEEKLIPLVREEIWPTIRDEASPLATEIGNALWNEVSIWRFGWRAVYDAAPLPSQNLTRKEFERFLERKGMPIIRSRTPDIVQLQQQILSKLSENPKVRTVVSESIRQVVDDPDVQAMLTDVFREVFLGNARLQRLLEEHWKAPEAQRALDKANTLLEPTITNIGMKLFGSIDEDIAPDFARVLRNKIMKKDSRWLFLNPRDESTVAELPAYEGPFEVYGGDTWTEHPFHRPAASGKVGATVE